MVEIVSLLYTLANLILGIVIYTKSRGNIISKFYMFLLGCMVILGADIFLLTQQFPITMQSLFETTAVFIYSLLPFFFIHFIILFVRRHEIFKSRHIIPMIYLVGLLGYLTILLKLIPSPISIGKEITPSAFTFYLTWMTIFFAIGIAMLYEVARGFYEKAGKANVLFASFVILLLILPGPFTESVFFKILKLNSVWYYLSSTISVALAVFFIFRHKIIVNTLYDAMKSSLAVLNDMLITTNENYKIEMAWGTTITRLLGYKENELIGLSLYQIIDQKEYLEKYKEFVVAKKMKESYIDIDIICKNGNRIPMNVSFAPIYWNDDISGFACLARDISDFKKLEEELRQAQKLESLGTLAGGIAHDFNNILQIMYLNNRTLKNTNNTPGQLTKAIELNDNAVKRGASLVKQLLTFARKSEVHFELINIDDTISELIKMLSQTFPKTILFEVSLDSKLPLLVADSNQLHQVLLNLCINSRDAMPGGGKISISTLVEKGDNVRRIYMDAYDNQYICIMISDTGVGMEEKIKQHIFEPFYTTKEKGKGTGLGLPVVYGIINSHHGYIRVESEKQVGTTFKIYLPTTINSVQLNQSPSAGVDTEYRGSETILLVEDEDTILNSLSDIFSERGYNIIVARDGEEAVRLYKQHRENIHLVLTDVGLPKLSGWEAFTQMKDINQDVRVIVASGYLEPLVKKEKIKAGVSEILSKPYDVDILLKTVRTVLDSGNIKLN
jgi:PAS domain S-box-containing protein